MAPANIEREPMYLDNAETSSKKQIFTIAGIILFLFVLTFGEVYLLYRSLKNTPGKAEMLEPVASASPVSKK